MKPIFLIGYMGCGKSTLARAVARATGLALIDLDTYIENRYRCTVPEIFANGGEARFRRLEQRMLHEVGEFEDVVVACGGGTPCFGDNMEWMRAHGLTVWLDASPERIHRRLSIARRKRPLVEGLSGDELMARIEAGLAERRHWYEQAEMRFDSDRLDTRDQVDGSTAQFIALTGIETPRQRYQNSKP